MHLNGEKNGDGHETPAFCAVGLPPTSALCPAAPAAGEMVTVCEICRYDDAPLLILRGCDGRGPVKPWLGPVYPAALRIQGWPRPPLFCRFLLDGGGAAGYTDKTIPL